MLKNILAATSEISLQTIEKLRPIWYEEVGESPDPFKYILVSPIDGSRRLMAMLKKHKDEYESHIFFDSGGYLTEKGKISYGYLVRNLLDIYKKYPWADWYVMPDYPPRHNDPPHIIEKKVQLTIQNVIKMWKESPSFIKERAVAPIQGFNLQQIDKTLDEYLGYDFNYMAFGAFKIVMKNKGVLLLDRKSAEYILHIQRRLKPYGVKLHVFGIGTFPSLYFFTKAGVYSFDNTSWIRGPKFGALSITMMPTFNAKTKETKSDLTIGETLTPEKFRMLNELWGHKCPWDEPWDELVAPGNEDRRVLHGLAALMDTLALSEKMSYKEVVAKYKKIGRKIPLGIELVGKLIHQRSLYDVFGGG